MLKGESVKRKLSNLHLNQWWMFFINTVTDYSLTQRDQKGEVEVAAINQTDFK